MSFKRFEAQDIVVSSDSITAAAWSNNTPILTSFFTSSIQGNSTAGDFYLSVFKDDVALTSSAQVEFDIAYCDILGSGSVRYNPLVEVNTPTRTNFGQYRSLVLEDEFADFKFGTGTNVVTGSNFYALSIERTRYKEKLFPGTFNLHLSNSNGLLQLTDDSNEILVNTFIGSQRAFQVISGSNGNSFSAGSGYSTNNGSYGLFLPDIGTILLNPSAISESIQLEPSRSNNSPGLNEQSLYDAIVLGKNFQLNSEETISSDFVFVRLRNSEFNYC